jgi:hypothetical protein
MQNGPGEVVPCWPGVALRYYGRQGRVVSGPGSAEFPEEWSAIPESVATKVAAIPVDIRPAAAAALSEAGRGWLDAGLAVPAARLLVAAWVTALSGDKSVLEGISGGEPGDPDGAHDASACDQVHHLLHLVHRNSVIAPHPEVTSIDLWHIDVGGDVPEIGVMWRFTGCERPDLPALPPGWTGPGQGEYVGSAYLRLTGRAPDAGGDRRPSPRGTEAPAELAPAGSPRPRPWRLARGHVETIDEYYGYKYATSDEAADGYRSRTGAAVSAAALVPSRTYRLVASFAGHDHEFGGDATSDVDGDTPPARDEAQRLAEDAINAEARRRMTAIYPGDGREAEARPSLSSLRVIRLLAPAPPVEPASEPTGAAVDDFARRYAASRDLSYHGRGTPTWMEPGPWFLSSLDITRSHGLIRGSVGGGRQGDTWYAEAASRGPGGPRDRWTVAHYVTMQAHRAGGVACAVRRGHGLRHGSPLPRGLTEAKTRDWQFDHRYVVGAAGGDLFPGDRPWAERIFTGDFTAWLRDQPYGRHGADATCFQLHGGQLCIYARGWHATAESLDAFRERAARIAAELEHATRYVIQ